MAGKPWDTCNLRFRSVLWYVSHHNVGTHDLPIFSYIGVNFHSFPFLDFLACGSSLRAPSSSSVAIRYQYSKVADGTLGLQAGRRPSPLQDTCIHVHTFSQARHLRARYPICARRQRLRSFPEKPFDEWQRDRQTGRFQNARSCQKYIHLPAMTAESFSRSAVAPVGAVRGVVGHLRRGLRFECSVGEPASSSPSNALRGLGNSTRVSGGGGVWLVAHEETRRGPDLWRRPSITSESLSTLSTQGHVFYLEV